VLKDNMGYDLRHLLVGSEGTLGLITAASLRLMPLPAERAAAWISVPSPEAALDLLQRLRAAMGGTVSAFELMSAQGLAFVKEKLPQIAVPPSGATDWVVLTEVADGAGAEIGRRFEAALEGALEDGSAVDALIAQNEAQQRSFWSVRESIPEANRLVGAVTSHDLSLPPSRLTEFVAAAGGLIAGFDPGLRANCFGHLGDGNIHYNIFPPRGRSRSDYAALRGDISRALHDLTHGLGGSIAAEHGVGRLKVAELVRYGDPAKVAAMRAIKAALDPKGILNPGAVLG
jgi:FAD/FMN-containing dehydrogenase